MDLATAIAGLNAAFDTYNDALAAVDATKQGIINAAQAVIDAAKTQPTNPLAKIGPNGKPVLPVKR